MMIENVIESPAVVDSGDEEIAIVDNEDYINITMDKMDVQTNQITLNVDLVCLGDVSLMLEYTASLQKSAEEYLDLLDFIPGIYCSSRFTAFDH